MFNCDKQSDANADQTTESKFVQISANNRIRVPNDLCLRCENAPDSIGEVEVERVEVMNFGDGVYVMAF